MKCISNNFTTDTGMTSKNIPSLDKIYNKVTVSTCHILNYSSSYPCSSQISTTLDIMIATATNTAIGHTSPEEVEKQGGRYNRVARGYCNRSSPNGKIFMNRILWYCNYCLIWFGMRTYYCKQNLYDCFASYHEPLVTNSLHIFPRSCSMFDV